MSDKPTERAAWECTAPHPLHPRWSSVLLHCPICGSERPTRHKGAAVAEDRTKEELAGINHELVAAHNALLATLAAAETRAEAAERKVAVVESLADQWDHLDRKRGDQLRNALRGDA